MFDFLLKEKLIEFQYNVCITIQFVSYEIGVYKYWKNLCTKKLGTQEKKKFRYRKNLQKINSKPLSISNKNIQIDNMLARRKLCIDSVLSRENIKTKSDNYFVDQIDL